MEGNDNTKGNAKSSNNTITNNNMDITGPNGNGNGEEIEKPEIEVPSDLIFDENGKQNV